jgi:hypothetical protein
MSSDRGVQRARWMMARRKQAAEDAVALDASLEDLTEVPCLTPKRISMRMTY